MKKLGVFTVLFGLLAMMLVFTFCTSGTARGEAEDESAAGESLALQEGMDFYRIVFNGEKFFAGGALNGMSIAIPGEPLGTTLLVESANGSAIQSVAVEENLPVTVITVNGSTVVIAGDVMENGEDGFLQSNMMHISQDGGKIWQELPGLYGRRINRESAMNLYASIEQLYYSDGLYYASLILGTVVYSSDLKTWNSSLDNMGTKAILATVNGQLMAWSSEGGSIYAGAQNEWKEYEIPQSNTVYTIFYNDGKYYAFSALDGSHGEFAPENMLFTSTDLKDWTMLQDFYPEETIPEKLVATENGVVGFTSHQRGNVGNLVYGPSPNELEIIHNEFTGISDIAFGNGVYVAVGAKGLWLVSTDGQNWERVQ